MAKNHKCWAMLPAVLLVAEAAALPVDITGVDDAASANVLAHLTIDDEGCDAPGWRIDRLMERASEETADAMESIGFYDSQATITRGTDGDCPGVSVVITAGEPILWRTVELSITGAAENEPAFIELLTQAPAQPGEVLLHGPLAQWKRRLADLAQERGYEDARFAESRVDVFPAEHAADIVMRFESGDRYHFGELILNQSVLDEDFLMRYVRFTPGEPFDRQQLRDLYVALVSTGFFESVVVRPLDADAEAHTIPVEVSLTPSRPTTYTAGGGLSTDTGPLLRLGYLNRRANKRGWQRGAELVLSPVVGELVGNLRVPVGDPRLRWLAFSGGFKYEDSDSVRSDSFQLGARHVGVTRGRWRETQFIDLLYEDFLVADQDGSSRLLIPGLNWVRKQADSVFLPRDGYRLDFVLKGALDGLVSDTSFLQGIADFKSVLPAPANGRLITQLRLGATAVDSVVELPASLRFFAGGDNSIRGYPYQSLGPTNDAGEVVGGTRLLLGSVEYEIPIQPSWGLAFFVDSGNAFDEEGLDAKTGVGAGVRWHSPVGPLRLDLAFPLDEAENSFQIHISLGPDL